MVDQAFADTIENHPAPADARPIRVSLSRVGDEVSLILCIGRATTGYTLTTTELNTLIDQFQAQVIKLEIARQRGE